jgi:hypothetical protein
MEEQQDASHSSSFERPKELLLTKNAIADLHQAAKWSYVISLIGFIYFGLVILFSLGLFVSFSRGLMDGFLSLVSPFATSSSGSLIAYPIIIYTIFSAIGLIPFLYLYRFSVRTKAAISNLDSLVLSEAFESLKSHYRFVAILLLLVITIQLLVALPAIFMAISLFSL